jgi:hypothetical protein
LDERVIATGPESINARTRTRCAFIVHKALAVKLRKQGVITELSHREFEHLCEAMRLHSDGHTQGEPAILACWDADRLDLGRVCIKPKPGQLCTSYAKHPQMIDNALRMSQKKPRTRFSTLKEPQ